MKNLYFEKRYGPDVRSGIKTQTVRCWARRMVNEGDLAKTNVGVVVRILVMREITLADLTDADAGLDGFATAALLRERLAEYYAGKNCPYYLIAFKVEPGANQTVPSGSLF